MYYKGIPLQLLQNLRRYEIHFNTFQVISKCTHLLTRNQWHIWVGNSSEVQIVDFAALKMGRFSPLSFPHVPNM
jgi:hypothetical protein